MVLSPAIPDEPDRTAAKTLVKQILAEDRIHLVQSKQAIENSRHRVLRIKVRPNPNTIHETASVSKEARASSTSTDLYPSTTRTAEVTYRRSDWCNSLGLFRRSRQPSTDIYYYGNFLRNDLLRSQNASNFSGQEQQEQHLPYLQRRNLRALQENWRRNHREAIDAWDREDGHIEHERLPTFPITDDVLQNLEPRQRILD